MPASPSRADTSPSCMTPRPDSDGSSSCRHEHAAREPLVLERLAEDPGAVHRPAVVGEAERPGVGELGHLGQRLAVESRVIEARNPTGTRASRRAASRRERSTGAESTTGSVFGIATTAT